jgi:hypothetical protein
MVCLDFKCQFLTIEKKNGGKFQEYEETFKEVSNALVMIKTQLDLKVTSIKEEQENLKKLEHSKNEVFA